MITKNAPRVGLARVITALLTALALTPATIAQPSPAVPLEPISAIVTAFETHDVVALGEGNHGNEQGALFREALYRDPRFQAAVNDIVVESGNSLHQAIMDRYIAGDDVSEKEVSIAWLETTATGDIWDREIYARMFRTVREINQTLPTNRQLRVLLGDSPYDRSAPDPQPRDDKFTAKLVEEQVIAKGRKALIVYGDMHFLRRHPEAIRMPSGELLEPYSIVTLLEDLGVEVFAIWTFAPTRGEDLTALQADVSSWPKPSLARVENTTLGLAPFPFYYPKGSGSTMRPGPNGPRIADYGEAIGGTLQDQVDALLYLGSKREITYSKLPKALCADPEYVEMRAARIAKVPSRFGGSPEAVFRAQCKAAVDGK